MSQLTLPSRQLKLSKKAIPGFRGSIFAGLLMVAGGGGLLYWQQPGLLHDWTISRNPVVVYDGDIQDGECTTHNGFFTDCSAHLAYDVDGTHFETDASLVFVDIHSGDYMVDLVRSGDDPSLATMSIGIEKLWNRIIVLAVLLAFTAGIGLLLIKKGFSDRRAARQLSQPGQMRVVPVVITSVESQKKRNNFTYRNPQGARPKAKFVAVFPRGEEPLLVGEGESTVALAVKHEGSDMPVLLDSGLERLDLTPGERRDALSSLGLAAS